MTIKIRLSYEEPAELREVIRLLSPRIKNYKVSKNNDGQYKKAYIELIGGKEKNE